MAVRDSIPYPAFDDLFLFCNRLWGRLDGELKKCSPRLTVTALLVLSEVAKRREVRERCNQARVAEALGISASSLTTTIRGLAANALLAVDADGQGRGNSLSLTAKGRNALHRGLVIREDVLSEFNSFVPGPSRRAFFAAAKAANAGFQAKRSDERHEEFVASFKHHKTRAFLRKANAKGRQEVERDA